MTDKKRILVFLGSLMNFGGGYQYILSILNAINQTINDKYIVSYYILNRGWCDVIPKESGVIYFAKEKFIYKILRKAFYLTDFSIAWWRKIANKTHPFYKEFDNISPDLIIFPSEIHFALGTKKATLAPIHDLMHLYESRFSEVGNKSENKKRELVYRNSCKYNKGILVDSSIGKNHLLDSYKVKENNIFILPYTIPPIFDFEKCESKIQNHDEISKLNVPDEYIFYPANLWEHKNHILILRALSKLLKSGLKINVVFTGSKKNAANIIFQEIEKLKLAEQVYYYEYVSDMTLVHLYKNAKALVMPTFFGPTNVPPLEAFASGCPVITSNIYGMKEQVGNAAILIDPNNENELSEAILKIFTDEDLRKSLVINGYEQLKKLNVEKFNDRFENIVMEVLK